MTRFTDKVEEKMEFINTFKTKISGIYESKLGAFDHESSPQIIQNIALQIDFFMKEYCIYL